MDYKNLFLMEFENSSKDPRTDYLRYGLPEIVRIKYADYDKITIQYAPKATSIFDNSVSNLRDGILLYGNFNTINDNIVISFNVYDVNTWEEKSNRSFKCDIDNIDCIENAFYVCVEEDVMSQFCEYFDCLGVCEGEAKTDCMGTCQGDAKLDCDNLCNGPNKLDECGICDTDLENDCIRDCNGEWGGKAYLNECDVCIDGSTGKGSDYGLDCKGVCWGEKRFDCDGVCGGEAIKDCQGVCNGTAYLNDCNVCVEGDTGNHDNKGMDCEGICFGDAVVDECGICNGMNVSCSDCFGAPYGKATSDNCGTCDTNPLNDCIQDCNGQWGGSAYINQCLVCVGGNTGNDDSMGIDCKGECWGESVYDECGVCDGPGAIYECGCIDLNADICDCEGNILDICGECGGEGIDQDNDGICDKFDEFIGEEQSLNNSLKLNIKDTADEVVLNHSNDDAVNIFGNYKSFDKNENTEKLYKIFDTDLFKVYNAIIDKSNIGNDYKSNIVAVSVPIEYSINYDVFLDLFKSFTYEIKNNSNGSVTLQFPKNNFNLTQQFEEYCSLMKYQMVPVLFFANESDEIKHIHVDSWENYSLGNISNEIDISYSYNFMPLFSITPGSEYLYFNFDLSKISHTYNFSFPKNDLESYSKLYIKFFFAENLESNILSYSINK